MNKRIVETGIATIGGGLAGMSLLAHVGASGWRGDVIVIDDGAYPLEDRTWSWWSRGDLLLDDAATAQFPSARCASDTWVKTGSLEPYAYRTITGAALSQTVSALASTGVRVTHVPGTAVAVSERDGAQACIVETADGRVAVRAARIYDSVGVGSERGARSGVPRLDFTGWRVRSATAVFNPAVMTLMDFRTDQSNGLAFVYVLPISSHEALIDHTVYVTNPAASRIDHERHARDYLASVCGAADATLVKVEEGPIRRRPRRGALRASWTASLSALSTCSPTLPRQCLRRWSGGSIGAISLPFSTRKRQYAITFASAYACPQRCSCARA